MIGLSQLDTYQKFAWEAGDPLFICPILKLGQVKSGSPASQDELLFSMV